MFPIPPLALPGSGTEAEVVDAEAVRLFVARASEVRPDITLTEAARPAIAEICERLDGLPLAIELAAARSNLLAPPAMLARLNQRLPLLTTSNRDQPARHHTMRNAIAWSHDLLTDAEQRLFRHLGVFVDGFSLEAAAVVAEDGLGTQSILVVELLTPAYDADAGTLTYDARVLADYAEAGIAHLAQQQTGYDLPESFGEGGLFIDDCSDASGYCYNVINGQDQEIGDLDDIGECYDWSKATCEPCNSDGTSEYYGKLCANAYPDQCSFDGSSWDCFAEITGVS